MDLNSSNNNLHGADGFVDIQDDGWRTVGKKGKKGKNGAVQPRQTRSLQNELISATGQESWWNEDSIEVTKNNIDIDSLPLWGESSSPPQRGHLSHPSSQRGSQYTFTNGSSSRRSIHTVPTVTHIPPVKASPKHTVAAVTDIPSVNSPPGPDQYITHLMGRFKFKLACRECFTKNPEKEGVNAYQFYQWPGHRCAKDQILCHLESIGTSTDVWGLIRPRTNPSHQGNFQLCLYFLQGGPCRSHSCHFAHSEEEMKLWFDERNGSFDRTKLVTYLRGVDDGQKRDQRATHHPADPPTHHPGAPSTHRTGAPSTHRTGAPSTMHHTGAPPTHHPGAPSTHHPGAPSTTHHPGAPSTTHHPPAGSSHISNIPPTTPSRTSSQPNPPSAKAQFHSGHSQPVGVRSPDRPPSSHHGQVTLTSVQMNGITPFPHRLRVVCKMCADRGPDSHQRENVNYCSVPDRHDWKVVVYLVLTRSGSWVGIHPREVTLSPYTKPELCKFLQNCFYEQRVGKPCKFPHFDEEIELWNYQAQYKLRTVEEVISVQRKGNSGHVIPPKKEPTQEKQTEWKHRDPPFVLSGNYRLCRYNLSESCSYSRAEDNYNFCSYAHSEEELKEWKLRHQVFFQQKNPAHRQQSVNYTENHGMTMPSQSSAYPRPPSTGQYHGTTMPAGQSIPYPKPPSRGEENGTTMSSQSSVYHRPPSTGQISSTTSYVTSTQRGQYPTTSRGHEQTSPQYHPNSGLTSSSTTQTATPKLVPMVVMPKTGLTPENVKKLLINKPIQEGGPFKTSYYHEWMFLIRKEHLIHLRRVDLRPSLHQRHFQISHSASQDGHACNVSFRSTVHGFFQQQLLVDFGTHELSIILFLTAVIGDSSSLPRNPVSQVEEPLTPQAPWTSNNSTIVPYSKENPLEPFYQRLLVTYPPPPARKVTFQPEEGFYPEVFKGYLHKLIQLEENACNEKISKFCCSSELVLTSDLRQVEVYQSALEGELFGTLKISKGLTDNSDASQIVTKMTRFILVKFSASSKIVYQSELFYGADQVLQLDDVIFVRISKKCVQDEKLKAGLKVQVHLQFQVDRVNFCSMHYGVDHFSLPQLAFPPSGESRFPRVRRVECEEMNPKQEAAARYVLGAGTRLEFQPGPTLISGPYGTGKTHTVAKIAMRLLLESSSTKILIATHTNSAADWYITEHLHPLLTRLSAVQKGLLLRIYATIVVPTRVNKVILDNYVLLDSNSHFRQPLLTDVVRSRIVIATLSTAIHLVELRQLHGQFTHIFIDEAGQALEAEVMIPLGLAGPSTVVVLAGDHKQMQPKVYSRECQQRHFQRSMLERLVIWNRSRRCGLVQSLTYNYRMRPEILKFIAQFYDGIPLETMGTHKRHPDIYPVSFCEVNGLEQQRGVSYVNDLEAQTIVYLIKTIVESSWPTNDWGNFEATNVCVITPYTSQVKHIRNLLRQHKLRHITVERVQNVQGKQFRVVFISTVHTRNKLLEEVKEADGKLSEETYRGFLSDEGELITAFTRSQSLLFVVGDPVALCTVGACRQAWWRYLQECDTNGSLLPEGTTLQTIMTDIQASARAMGQASQDDGNVRQVNPFMT